MNTATGAGHHRSRGSHELHGGGQLGGEAPLSDVLIFKKSMMIITLQVLQRVAKNCKPGKAGLRALEWFSSEAACVAAGGGRGAAA